MINDADVKSGKVKVYAPAGFMKEAVSENIMAGNAMSRRASYMYGNLLKPDAKVRSVRVWGRQPPPVR